MALKTSNVRNQRAAGVRARRMLDAAHDALGVNRYEQALVYSALACSELRKIVDADSLAALQLHMDGRLAPETKFAAVEDDDTRAPIEIDREEEGRKIAAEKELDRLLHEIAEASGRSLGDVCRTLWSAIRGEPVPYALASAPTLARLRQLSQTMQGWYLAGTNDGGDLDWVALDDMPRAMAVEASA